LPGATTCAAAPSRRAHRSWRLSGVRLPVAHHDGNYVTDRATRDALAAEDRVALRYAEEVNGSADRIAGILSSNRRVLGLMPHPERASDPALGATDGAPMFRAVGQFMAAA
jgi:phosphoribosylformylglycinamidine synthase